MHLRTTLARRPGPALAPRWRATAVVLWSLAAIVLGAFVGVVSFLVDGNVAHADNSVVESTPADGGTATTSLSEVRLVFENEFVGSVDATLICDNDPVTIDPVLGDDNQSMIVNITGDLPEADCNLSWTTYDDGDDIESEGRISFDVVGSAAEVETPTTDPESTDIAVSDSSGGVSEGPLWLGRVLSVAGISVVFGAIVLMVAAWPEGPEYVMALRFLRTAWIVGAIGSLLYVATIAGAVNGEGVGGGLNPATWFDLFDYGWPGRMAVARIVFVGASLWVVMRPERALDPATNMVAVAIPALAVLTLAFSREGGPTALLGVVASIVHVFGVAVWFGGVVFLAWVVLAGPGDEDLVHAVDGFARLSNPAIAAVVVSGLIQLFRLVGGELFTSGHGRVLLVKTLAVAGMIFVGMTARQVARARLARAHELAPRVADRLRRAFLTEVAIGVVVLMLSGWMLSFVPGKYSGDGGGGAGSSTVVKEIRDDDSGLEMTVYLRPGRVGVENDLWVEVSSPTSGLSGVTLTFIPPEGSGGTGLTGAIPELTGDLTAGTADGAGLTFDVAGPWQLRVDADTEAGSAQGVQTQIEIANADGTLAPLGDADVPPIEIPPTTAPTGPTIPPETDPPANDG